MIRHVFTLIWNRRRANTLIAIEILLSFLVLCAVATMGLYLADNYRQPLGFVYQDVWSVRVDMNAAEQPGPERREHSPEERRARLSTLLGLIRDMPDVVSASVANVAPYSQSDWISVIGVKGRSYEFAANRADDDFDETMRLTVSRGRWFNASDDGAAWDPVVINERLAREMFPDQDPVGRIIQPDAPPADGPPPQPAMKIVGVMTDYRKSGELSPVSNWVFFRTTLGAATQGPNVPRYLVVRARPGTAAAFESALMERLNASAPDWSFRARPLTLARSTVLRGGMPILAAGGLIAAFLLAMVTLGLTGVLWLTVTQRTREIGLRRAKGATARNIQRQIRGEVVAITALAVLAGAAIVVQLPVLEVTEHVQPRIYAAGLALSTACIFALTIACTWAPGRMASAIEPAEALRWE